MLAGRVGCSLALVAVGRPPPRVQRAPRGGRLASWSACNSALIMRPALAPSVYRQALSLSRIIQSAARP